MTKEVLARANAINNRLGKVTAFLNSIDETDPSGIDTTTRLSPITLSAGMAQTIDFNYSPEVDTDVQKIDNYVRDTIIGILTGYKQKLEVLLNGI